MDLLDLPFTPETAREICGLSPSTWTRIRNGEQPLRPVYQKLLRIHAGECPWPGWEALQVNQGRLYGVGINTGLTPSDLRNYWITLQRIRQLERQQAAPAQYLLDF